MDVRRRVVAGLLAGALATAPMSAVMWAAQRLGAMGGMPPRKITEAALGRKGRRHLPSPARRAGAAALHLAFGAAAGAAYALWPGATRQRLGIGPGIAWALVVWGASYAGWVPALGIMPPPHRDRRGRPASMVAAHVVYGAVLGRSVARTGARDAQPIPA